MTMNEWNRCKRNTTGCTKETTRGESTMPNQQTKEFVLTYSVNVYVPATDQADAIKRADCMLNMFGSEKMTIDLEAVN